MGVRMRAWVLLPFAGGPVGVGYIITRRGWGFKEKVCDLFGVGVAGDGGFKDPIELYLHSAI
jgi:hypothetical protein